MQTEEISKKEVTVKMAALCSRSEQCSPDIRKKITALGIESDGADEIIDQLKNEKFIDDERFVKAYAADKFRINKWGKIKIRYYLKLKGLPEEIIATGLDGIDDEKYTQTLIEVLKAKAKTIKKKPKFEKMGQLIRFAQNRGFEPELIHRHLNEVIQ